MPVVYTCWLRDEAKGEPPVKLFDAKCRPRWLCRRKPRRALAPARAIESFTSTQLRTGATRSFAYDLKTKTSRKVFPHEAPALDLRLVAGWQTPRLRAWHDEQRRQRRRGPRWPLDRSARCGP